MDLIEYSNNPNDQVTPFGLVNIGGTCWFNSLLQCLLSCPSFNQTIINNYNKFIRTKNYLGLELYKLINSTSLYNPRNLYMTFINYMKNNKMSIQDIYRVQGDPNEGFLKLLECLNCNDIDELFEIRFKTYIICGNCKYKSKENIETGFHTELFSDNTDDNYLNNPKDFARKIICQINDQSDYRCDKCNQMHENTKYVYRLLRIPTIFPVLLNKYNRSNNINYPLEFTMSYKDNIRKLYFKLVSVATHSGNLSGGHHYSHGLRNINNNDTFYLFNDSYVRVDDKFNKKNTYFTFYHFDKLK